jgi:lysozyme
MAAIITLCQLRDIPRSANPSYEQYPIRGIDISAHNGLVDFEKVAADSIKFALIKATEGSSFKDPKFDYNYRAAKGAGLKVGVYHFFRFDVDGTIQGINLINSIQRLHLDLPLVIDVEEWTNPRHTSTELVLTRLNSMIVHLRNSGYNVMLYSNKDGHNRFLRSRDSAIPLWICSIPDSPIGIDWHIWQYTHRGRIPGIHGAVDINVFNGSENDWIQWLSTYNDSTAIETTLYNKADLPHVM